MIDELYEKFNYLFKRYGDPIKWKDNIKVKYGITAWDIESLKSLYYVYVLNGTMKEFIAVNGPISRIELSYDGNIDSLISKINSTPNIDSLEVIYIPNEINDLDHLNKLKNSFPNKTIIVNWNNDNVYIDDVISAIYMIDYYKQVIDDNDFSPLEKITMAYDIIKSFYYKDSAINSQASQVVNNGTFRCKGFVEFFNKLLNELGMTTFFLNVTIRQGKFSDLHVRSIVQVVDEKYQKNGYFVFDPTFDSVSNVRYYKYKANTVKIRANKRYGYNKGDSLCQYKHFLVPFISYEKAFPASYNEHISTISRSDEELHQLLHDNQSSNIVKALSAEDFIKLLYKVRLAEGYSIDDIPHIIQEALLASGYNYYHIDAIKNYINSISEKDNKMVA